jgi:NAD(P)-dependent dehydrogenase (short-subunit alcohol dehydrogenase family)
MDLGLKDKIAVVTGASKGIGLAVTQHLAAEGATVVAGARTLSPELEALVAGGTVTFAHADFAKPEAPGALVRHAIDLHGGVDLLVNNVGGGDIRFDGFLGTPESEWIRVFDFNVMTAVRTCLVAIPSMIERGGGSIVNISSINAMLPQTYVIDYSAAKAALKNLGKGLSEEFGPKGVRVNTVSPGATSTPLWTEPEKGAAHRYGKAIGKTADEVIDMIAAGFALGRFATADEVAAMVTLLLSPRAGSVTGADVVVDAGTLKQM